MGFLAPWFLAGVVGVSLPLFLHLLKRQKNPPKLVPSLMLYESRVISSTRHKRLHYLLLLALRLLFLLLLILAFANPFVNRDAASLSANRLVLLVIDNSFSMRTKTASGSTRLADAKDAAMQVLSGKGAARGEVAAFGSQLRLMTQPIEDQPALRAAVQAIQPGDGHGNFAELARAVRATAEAMRTPIELHVFSDMQRTELAPSFADMALPGQCEADRARRRNQSTAELDGRIGGCSGAGVGQRREARARAGRHRRIWHARRPAHCLISSER